METMFLWGSLVRDRRSQPSLGGGYKLGSRCAAIKEYLTVLRLFGADLFEATPRRAPHHVAEGMRCRGPRLSKKGRQLKISTHLLGGPGKARRLLISSTPAIPTSLLPLRSLPQPAKASGSPEASCLHLWHRRLAVSMPSVDPAAVTVWMGP